MVKLLQKKRWIFLSFVLLLLADPLLAQDLASTNIRWLQTSQQEHQKQKTLEFLLQELEKKYQVNFAYQRKLIENIYVSSSIYDVKNFEDYLKQVLTPNNLKFKKIDNYYVIQPLEKETSRTEKLKESALYTSIETSVARNNVLLDKLSSRINSVQFKELPINGKITSAEDGAPLPGVNVIIKGTTNGTVTDANGNYSLSVSDGDVTLVFSFIGYTTEEVVVAGRTQINMSLVGDIRQLTEVVVVGYGTQKRSEVTSSVASVKAAEFRQMGARNAMDLIQGKVAGLTINRNSGTNPNSGVALQIRGVTSLTGSREPLVVIDGIPGGNLDLLQQDDIEAIDILKDGSAAAIYGTQANGGVILVTTKKGKEGPARFDYSTYFRKEYVQRKPEFLNAEEYREKIAAGLILQDNDLGASVNAFDMLINDHNVSQYHNLALSGGSSNTNYRASLFYSDLQGIARENSRQQYGGRLSINQIGLNEMLTAQINLATNFNKANLLGGGGWEWAFVRNPTQSLTNPDGTWFFDPTNTNEIARLQQETNRRKQQTTSADGKVSLEPIKGLRASLFGSVQRNSYLDGAYRSLNSEYSLENDLYKNGGYASRNTVLEQKYAFEPTVEYAKFIDNGHSITAIAGYSWRYELYEGFNAYNLGFINDIFKENNLSEGNQINTGKAGMDSYKNDNTLIAFFGRLNYSFKDKYMAQFILRHEGSSRFGANNKWGNFPAVSAGWNISSEEFMSNISFIDNLKLRVGYGITGNSGIGNYSSLVTLGTGGTYINPSPDPTVPPQWRQTYGPNRNPNPDLRWEKKKELNIGVDFSVMKNRVGGSIEFYNRVTEDLLETFTSQLPPFVRENIYTNVGSISSTGVEITLNATPVKTKDFTWTVDFAASGANNILKSFSNDVYKITNKEYASIGGYGALGNAIRTFEGGALGNFYGKRFAGFDEDGNWLFYKRDGSKVPSNEIINSSDPNLSDFTVIGNGIPKYHVALTNTFQYKNFDFRVFLRGRFDYEILNTLEMFYGNKVQLPNNVLKSAFEKHAELNDTYQYSSYYIEPGDYVKLDEISIGYNFDVRRAYVRNLRVYVTGSNLATFTKYSGSDPDLVRVTGLNPGVDALNTSDDRSPYASTRSFLIGLNVGF